MPPEPRSEVLNLASAVHGAFDFAELKRLGLDPQEVLDFSVNSNPYGPSPAVREAVARVPLDRYPDREALALRGALAAYLDVPVNQIMVANGTAELLWLVGLAFLRPGDQIFIVNPTFGEYVRVGMLIGAQVTTWWAQAESGFLVEPEAIAQHLAQVQPRLVFLCNPNNPTGTIVLPEGIALWARQYPETLFVIDEAYGAFAPSFRSALTLGADNIVALHSMTKDYALAGLRLGYAVGPEDIIDALARVRPPWSVNALAQAAGIAALADRRYLEQSLEKLARAKEILVAGLAELGLAPLPSTVNFFLVRVGDGTAFRRTLLGQGLLVRDCTSFGLPAFVRIATRRLEENRRLLMAIREEIVEQSV